MTTNILTESNFVSFALYNYFSTEHINSEEFNKSLKTITYINRLLRKDDNINHRLILNHIIITANTFGIQPTVEMILFKISKDKYNKILTYLYFLGYTYSEDENDLDMELLQILENL